MTRKKYIYKGPAGRREFERRKAEERERLEAQAMRYDINKVTELKGASDLPILESYPGMRLRRVGDGPYAMYRKF